MYRTTYFTYRTVVNASSDVIQMVLVLSTLLRLNSWQVDYTQAFLQAPLDDDAFMHIPQWWYFGPESQQLCPNTSNLTSCDTQHCIWLKCNLYGVKQAAQNWYLHLKQGLISHGFIQSNINPCLFIQNNCILMVYTNDCLMFAQDDTTIDDLCQCLSTEFLLQDKGDITGYLGIQITHTTEPDGSITITMTQPSLIDQILEDIGLTGEKVTQKHMPVMQILQPNPSTAPFNATWNYRSLIGKLNFLAQNTCPDISMPIHMCAHYVNNPNWSHQDAMKYLCQYLHLTWTRSLILKPTSDNRLNAYVNSDFAGMWSHATSQLCNSTVSCNS